MTRIIFEAPYHNDTSGKIQTNLTKLPHIKLAPGEKLICVQRQHWLILTGRMILPLLAFLLLPLIFFFLPADLIGPFFPDFVILQAYFIIGGLIAVLLIEIYLFMDWYYQFYIISNRCILYMRFFRLGGYYFDEVFHDQIKQQEFSRSASNFVYDLLGLYDVSVYFSHIERPEPFVFHAPSDSSTIENILEDLTVKEIERKERKK